ncbi:MAG TPA: helix-turn-helix transcriptional regulator [Spirochaetota bacterium]|jgi:transcriptional regulator with XRE-family HTH domain|nr:helix-turn-helix transcriptional regulator [Spirochaetota bacterium]OPZ36393.1 MAG: helix-turn-helix protein [Spirochaetes bacterium ADurb.BinA120]HNU90832.1 helix-turn-helix transcriptional regulator [Spirochaetota bacterium]HPV97186.1 helix-turn-helix transcriptional regulator [Spirochaetota bacterium]
MFNPDFFFHDFAFIVLDLRKKYDISQEYCAELACIHRNTIARMESGRTEYAPSRSFVSTVSSAYGGCPARYMVSPPTVLIPAATTLFI